MLLRYPWLDCLNFLLIIPACRSRAQDELWKALRLNHPGGGAGPLQQHWVPPFQHHGSREKTTMTGFLPVEHKKNHNIIESLENFYCIHVKKEKNSGPHSVDFLFDELKKRQEKAPSFQSSYVKNKQRRSSLLRGGSDHQVSIRRFLDSPFRDGENDYTISVEYDFTPQNETTPFLGNSSNSTLSNIINGDTQYMNTSVNPIDSSFTLHIKGEKNQTNNVSVTNITSTTNGTLNNGGSENLGNTTTNMDEEIGGSKNKSEYRPIRLLAVLSESFGGGEHLTPNQLHSLFEDMVRPAFLAWSEALRVPWDDKNLTLNPKQWPDGTTCGPGLNSGLPTARVPTDHVLYGVPDTDLVVYLNLAFVYVDDLPNNSSTSNSTNATSSASLLNASQLPPNTNNKAPTSNNKARPTASPSRITNSSQSYSPAKLSNASQLAPGGTSNSSAVGWLSQNSTIQMNIQAGYVIDSLTGGETSNTKVVGGTNLTTKLVDGNGIYYHEVGGILLEALPNNNNNNNTDPKSKATHNSTNNTSLKEGNGTSTGSLPQNSTNGTTSTSVPKTPKPRCAGDYLASSLFCSTNDLDRPTAALLHICIGPDFFNDKHLARNILTIMHEMGHALGFNLQGLAHFRRPDGSPITPRDATGAVPAGVVECTGPQIPGGRPFTRVPLPSPEILQFRIVRGDVRVAEVVTPSVAQVVRNHFDCQTLKGAELESTEYLPPSTNPGLMTCLGNHWERRLFKMDLMNPIIDDLPFDALISSLTLAFFADSGWYQVNLSRAAVAAFWGRAAGCSFVEKPCIQENGELVSGSDSLFCNSASKFDSRGYVTTLDGCTPDFTRKAACTMSQYDGDLPPDYQYFSRTYGANVGGLDPFMDYCPVYNGIKNGLCSDPANTGTIEISSAERVGSRNSRCLAGTSNPDTNNRVAMCLRVACVVEDRSLRVQVEGKWHTCTYKDQPIASTASEQVLCPDPIRVCPTFFCPRDCLGTKQICDYSRGLCVCNSSAGVIDVPLADGSCPVPTQNTTITGQERNGTGGQDQGAIVNKKESSIYAGTGGSSSGGPGIFYIPPNANPSMPRSGTLLGDIYFPDERTLAADKTQVDFGFDQKKSLKLDWKFGLFFLMIVCFLARVFWEKRGFLVVASGDHPNDGSGAAIMPREQRRNKEKMIAVVLVDLRMNDPNLENFRDVLIQRSSETDDSMTDTDPGTVTAWEQQSGFGESSSAAEPRTGIHRSEEEPATANSTVSMIPTMDTPTARSGYRTPRGNGIIRRRFFRRRQNAGNRAYGTDSTIV